MSNRAPRMLGHPVGLRLRRRGSNRARRFGTHNAKLKRIAGKSAQDRRPHIGGRSA